MRKIPTFLLSLAAAAATAVSSFGAAFITDFNSGLPAGTTAYGTAGHRPNGGVDNTGLLRLTDNVNSSVGAFHVNDFAGGIAVTNFRVIARVAIGGGTGRPADGMGFGFGNDLPNGLWASEAEEPRFNGINVSMDTWDNGGEDTAPALDYRVGAVIGGFQSLDTNYNNASIRPGREPAGPIFTNSAGEPVSLLTFGVSPDMPANENFVPLLIELTGDNRLTVVWSNNVIFNQVEVTNYTPISGGKFGFAARTGGANAKHWVDNLQIYVNYAPGPVSFTEEPASLTVVESREAVFTAELTGTPPYNIQWFSNGVAIAGATSPTHRIANPTTNMSGDVYSVQVSNEEQTTPIVSQDATLTVLPRVITVDVGSRFTANQVFVRYSKPVNLNGTYTLSPTLAVLSTAHGASSNEVVLTTSTLTPNTDYTLTISGVTGQDGSPLENEPSVLSFSHGTAFCRNFDDGRLHPGGILSGTAYIGTNGALHLTDAVNSSTGWYFIPGSGSFATNLTMTWQNLVGGGTGGGADGMSFNWAPGLTPANGGTAEEGVGNGLSATIDTFDNGTGQDEGIEIKWQGQRVAYTKIVKDNPGDGNFIRNNTFVDASLTVSNDVVTFNWSNQVVTATIPGFGILNGNYLFMARTGGANDNHWIDDLCINDYTPIGENVSFVQSPTNMAILTGQSATFRAIPGGSPRFTYQWFTNGVAVPNQTNSTFTISNAARSMSGMEVSVSAANQFSSATSGVATLTVTSNPRVLSAAFESNTRIKIVYNEPVDLNSGTYDLVGSGFFENFREYGTTHNEVIWVSDTAFSPTATYTLRIEGVVNEETGDPLVPDPTDVEVRLRGAFFTDFNNNTIPPGTQLNGVAYVTNGVLHLTDAVAGVQGSYFIPDPANGSNVTTLFMSWNALIGGGNAADGMSLSWASDIAPNTVTGEDGAGGGLVVSVDTFDNTPGCDNCPTGTDTGVEIAWRGRRVAYQHPGGGAPWAPLRKNAFIDASVLIVPDDTGTNASISYKFDTFTITGTLTNFTGMQNGNFLFAARTGGAHDNHWVDNIAINAFFPGPANITEQPQSASVFRGETATFTVDVDGTPPYFYQWFTNGVAVAGATSSTFVSPPATEETDGLDVTVEVSNALGTNMSEVATFSLRRDPQLASLYINGSNTVLVTFTEPVDLASGTYTVELAGGGTGPALTGRAYGADHRTLILTFDQNFNLGQAYNVTIAGVTGEGTGLATIPDPITRLTSFTPGTPVCYDFNDNMLPAGTQTNGTAYIAGGVLHLTDGANSQEGRYFIPDQANGSTVERLFARWRTYIGDGNTGADGMSFNWAANLAAGTGGTAEEGVGNGLSVTIDTFDNGDGGQGPDNGIEIKWNGQRLAHQSIPKNNSNNDGVYIRRHAFVETEVIVQPNGTAIFSYDGNTISATIPNWTGIAGGKFLFFARTGGANDRHWIDDLQINCFTPGPAGFATDVQDVVVNPGNRPTLSFAPNGTPPYTITWYSNDVVVSSTGAAAFAPVIPTGESADFYAVISNGDGGAVTSRTATATVRTLLTISRDTNDNVTVSWPGTGWVLQGNNDLGDTNGWGDLPQFSTSPLVIPAGFFGPGETNVFFRARLSEGVLSANAVGIVQKVAEPGFTLLANPLNAPGGNSISQVLPNGVGLSVFTYENGSFNIRTWDDPADDWSTNGIALAPGTGFFVRNLEDTNITIKFVGTVPQGTLNNSLAAGFNLEGSIVPEAGRLDTDLGLPAEPGDRVFKYNPATGTYQITTFEMDDAGNLGWTNPSAAVMDVAEGFFIFTPDAKTWTRNFSPVE